MAFSTFRVYFQNPKGQKEYLEYDLFDHIVTAKWIVAMVYAYENGLPLASQNINLKPSDEVGHRIFSQLQTNLQTVAKLGSQTLKPLNVKTFKDVDSLTMNRLHHDFHVFEESLQNEGSMIFNELRLTMSKLNGLIHELENVLYCKDPSNYYYQSVTYIYRFAKAFPTEPSDYEWFKGENNFGDLLLGYGTIGKSIDQCFLSNDVELVKKGLVRPQKKITTEVVLSFPSVNPAPGSWDQYQADVKAWANQFDLRSLGYDLKDPAFFQFGSPKLGKLKQKLNNESVFSFLSEYNQVFKTELQR